ncbi:uncharacterized protein LOC131253621 [Magnolia sinica]|uniref:uncharacterized protein LOC131253621 n=1 Tax=Magnolia sinica TaxID=86752 RepID=UPI002659EB2A|nr:uncharacterized protein LOC131253621 [Magnolia sinica]
MESLGHQIHPIFLLVKPIMVFRPSITHKNHLKTTTIILKNGQIQCGSLPKPVARIMGSREPELDLHDWIPPQFRWPDWWTPPPKPGAYAMTLEKPDQEQVLDADRWISPDQEQVLDADRWISPDQEQELDADHCVSLHFGWSSRWAPVVNPEARVMASDELNEPDQKQESDLDRRILAPEGDDGGELGLAEELEHLEEEAIAGEDVGRDAMDYDRRAHLFDESARVFQDLKERDDHSSGP